MRIPYLALLALLSLSTGCFTEIRASSHTQLAERRSQMTLNAAQDESLQLLMEAFGQRGYSLIDRTPAKGGNGQMECVFKGSRQNITTVAGNKYGVSSSSNVVGSVFYVRLKPLPDGRTQAFFLGKPTVDGNPVCSDEDAAFGLTCNPVTAGVGWTGRNQMTGQDEAEVIRSVIVEFAVKKKGEEPTEPASGPVRCTPENMPGYQTADAYTKKRLLIECANRGAAAPPASETK